ncbi:MAG: hypothetical protein ACE5RJ_00380 [Nitrosopumilaceae archaeon]
MTSKTALLAVLFTGVLIFGGSQLAFGAQLAVNINPNANSSPFEMKYQKSIVIEYEDGGEIAKMLRGQEDKLFFSGDTSNPGVADLQQRLNQKLAQDGSQGHIINLVVTYDAELTGRALNTSIDYKIILTGDLTNYVIKKGDRSQPALLDMAWRGMTVQGPVIIDGHDINSMYAGIQEMEPQLAAAMAGSEAQSVLSESLMNAEQIKDQPLGNWHFLFDPTGINVDAAQFGISEEIQGFVISGFTMGESSIREGRKIEQVQEASFTTDKTYVVRAIASADNANLHIIGFAAIDSLEGIEIVGVTPTPPEGYATTSTGQFPVMIIYGMAAMAAIGGGAFFMFSNRQLKRQKETGQTGIDPSRLRAYETSAGSGGYKTTRGEAQLIDDTDYQKTRSVYDEPSTQQSPPPAAPAESEATCGCATSAEMGSECDCEMQGECLCDATCKCNAKVCKEQVKSMQ